MSERSSSRTLSGWMDVLDRIDWVLHESLAAFPEPAEAAPAGPDAASAAMPALDARLARWQECLDRAGRQAAEAEQQVLVEEEALRQLTTQVATTREKLAGLMKKPG